MAEDKRPKPHYGLLRRALVTQTRQLIGSHLQRKPELPGGTPIKIAEAAISGNMKDDEFWCGSTHFRAMFPSDLAMAFEGTFNRERRKYWQNIITSMVKRSAEVKEVRSAFMGKYEVNNPLPRVDNLPSLLYLVGRLYDHIENEKDKQEFLDSVKPDLISLIRLYEEKYLDGSLVNTTQAVDWKDTIMRPSSSWANIWVLQMLVDAGKLDIPTLNKPEAFREQLLKSCFDEGKGYFIDHQETKNTKNIGIDACVLALYLGLFPENINQLINNLQQLKIFSPYLMRVAIEDYPKEFEPILTAIISPRYHSAIWPHLGMMYSVGLMKSGRYTEAEKHIKNMRELIMKYKNIPEVLQLDGTPYKAILPCEWSFTMGAGLYLEAEEMLKQHQRLTAIDST